MRTKNECSEWENERLAEQAQAGSGEALTQLWEQVKRLLYYKARRFYSRCGADTCTRHGVTLEDLEQECYFAFLDAVEAYKPENGYQFTAYLNYAAKNRFRACMGIRSMKRDALDYSESMDAPAENAEGDPLDRGNLLPDPKAAAELEEVDDREELFYFRHVLEQGLNRIKPIRAQVLRCMYFDDLTGKQTAEQLCIRENDVRREVTMGLRNMRRDWRVQKLRDEYIEGNACKHVGFSAWEWKGIVEERLVER